MASIPFRPAVIVAMPRRDPDSVDGLLKGPQRNDLNLGNTPVLPRKNGGNEIFFDMLVLTTKDVVS